MKTLIRYSFVAMLALATGSSVSETQVGSTRNAFVLVPIPSDAVHHHQQGAPHIRNKNGTSQNWGGYAVESDLSAPLNGAVSDVVGTWVVPSVSSSGSTYTYSSVWVGIDGYSDNTVEQTGTEQDITPNGPVYYAWFEMYPKFAYRILNFPVAAGDTISAEVRYVGNDRFTLTIANLTRNVSFSTTQRSHKAKRQSAEWIVEPPYSGGILPLANFGTVTLSGCAATLNEHMGTISDPSWQYDAILMAYPGGPVKAQPSGLSGDGTSFSVTWQHE